MTSVAAEIFRAREVYRYYQPTNLSGSIDSSGFSKTQGLNPLQSFSDTALTAFAQLIAIRLTAQRAIVSLADHENEYFLAESTSSLSHFDDGPAQNAWLSISGARVPLEASLSKETLQLVASEASTGKITSVLFIPDLRLHETMSKLHCVKDAPYLRFYCGVPLINQKGVNIGSVYVVDDKPRSEFSLEDALFLNTMSATVMDHLEGIRAKEEVARVTRMSQALHAFVEGDGTMEGDWQRLKRYNLPSGAGVAFHWESNKPDGKKVQRSKVPPRSLSHASSETSDNSPNSPGLSPLQHPTSNQDARFNYNNSPWGSSAGYVGEQQQPSLGLGGGPGAKVGNDGVDKDQEFSTDGFSNLLHETFSRASNLVREGMEVDGAVFFDAPFRFYQGRSTLQPDTRRSDPYTTETLTESSDDEEHPIRPGPTPHVRRSQTRPILENRRVETDGIKSDILGFSTANSSSWDDEDTKDHPSFQSINQSLLTSLVKRYPKGELFVFDENGLVLPLPVSTVRGSEATIVPATSHGKRTFDEAEKNHDLQDLLASFPKARQIFFVPLYDSTSGCFIGSFAWSNSKTRIFSVENHLGYLIAFGHSLMSEVTRLNTLSADHAKGDFISNVSHELRSPLHGVLASVEFLADTALDGFQRNLVETVDICGRTLLDTIEHVLDFSKIKKFGQDSMQSMGVLADLDVSAVIEEVLEGVFAGFEFNGLSSLGLADKTKSHSQGSLSDHGALANDSPTIILDMGFRKQWKFPTVPGTWRRLTMNIFGNALKYTKSGYIKVKLEARGIPSVEAGKKTQVVEKTLIILTVSDSGQGMSSEFMKTKLFMPFSQEDVTAPGTGLGLSIVKEIVDLSGGTIDVRSEIGQGTEITLSLPLENCASTPNKTPTATELSGTFDQIEEPVLAVRRRAKGRTVTIRGFEVVPGNSDLQNVSLAGLKASIEKYITEWFMLDIVSDDKAADILICDESALVHSSATELKFQALLILCSNSARRDIYTAKLDASQSIEFVGKPCGPHRLAKAFLNCFDTEDAMKLNPEQRVSDLNLGSEIAGSDRTPPTRMTLDISKSSRLIGNIQSSIGFSPTANIHKSPRIGENSESPLKRRPDPWHKEYESAEIKFETKTSSPETLTGNQTPVPSSSSLAPSNSTSQFKEQSRKSEQSSAPVPKMLLVEDNPVNMMLLETYMTKNKWELEKASNGLLAMQAFQNRPEGFGVIFMDVSMPVMSGYESTRLIRSIEAERRIAYENQQRIQSPWLAPPEPSFPFYAKSSGASASPSSFPSIDLHLSMPKLKLNKPALIIALTGFSSEKDQEMAFEAGVDVFMTKPVRFREVGKILEGWMKSRELESFGIEVVARKKETVGSKSAK